MWAQEPDMSRTLALVPAAVVTEFPALAQHRGGGGYRGARLWTDTS